MLHVVALMVDRTQFIRRAATGTFRHESETNSRLSDCGAGWMYLPITYYRTRLDPPDLNSTSVKTQKGFQ